MANLKNRSRFAVSERADQRIALTSVDGSRIELFVLADDIIRVFVLPHGELRGPRTWSIASGQDDVPLEGRDRYDDRSTSAASRPRRSRCRAVRIVSSSQRRESG